MQRHKVLMGGSQSAALQSVTHHQVQVFLVGEGMKNGPCSAGVVGDEEHHDEALEALLCDGFPLVLQRDDLIRALIFQPIKQHTGGGFPQFQIKTFQLKALHVIMVHEIIEIGIANAEYAAQGFLELCGQRLPRAKHGGTPQAESVRAGVARHGSAQLTPLASTKGVNGICTCSAAWPKAE